MKSFGKVSSISRNSILPSLTRFRSISSRTFSSEITSESKVINSSRIQEVRQKMKHDNASLSGFIQSYGISDKGRKFLDMVNKDFNKKYSRGGKNGEGYIGVKEVIELLGKSEKIYYSEKDLISVLELANQIQDRMRVKISKSYMDHALNIPKNSLYCNPILKVVLPDKNEVSDLSGEIDPSNQNRYSPLPGLLHKYEMLLAMVSINCSGHCRYCYRLDLFNGTSNKTKADMPLIAAYIKVYNNLIQGAIKEFGKFDDKLELWIHKDTGEPLMEIREILFSGGDPLTLPNSSIARYMVLMAEAGIVSIRFGTKELVFNPQRFDEDFWKFMDLFHKNYPEVRVEIVGHYVHPYELLEPITDERGQYLYNIKLPYKIRDDINPVLDEISKRRNWIGHFNQFPIIAGINDVPKVIRLLTYQTNKMGIVMHNIYACREIIGNAHFRQENTIESQYKIVESSKISLSGIDNHARLIMSTEYGKMEVIGLEKNCVLLQVNRFAHNNKPDNNVIRVDLSKLPAGEKFYWLTEEIIKIAVDDEGKKILEQLTKEDNSLAVKFKKAAAMEVSKNFVKDNLEQESSVTKLPNKIVTIEIKNKNGSRFVYVDLEKDQSFKKAPTLATILKKEGEIEAACQEQLSCSTCVGVVETDSKKIPSPSEDELDLLDSVTKNIPNANKINIRATCQIKVSDGNYKFTDLQKN